MRKKYLKLTKEQKKEGIIFSSCLSAYDFECGTIHEVKETDTDKWKKIDRLKNDKFFRDSHYKYNIIRS